MKFFGNRRQTAAATNAIVPSLDEVSDAHYCGVARLQSSPDPKFATQLERQLAKDGPRSILKSLQSLERRLIEHRKKLGVVEYQTSVEREIRTLEKQLDTLKQFIKERGVQ